MKSKKKIILNLKKYKISRLNFILGGDDEPISQTQNTNSKVILKCTKTADKSKDDDMACPTQDSKDRNRC